MKKKDIKLAADELFQYAVKSLSRRAQSTAELKAKLQRRAAEVSDIEGIIRRLEEYGYLNDRRFAEGFATARLENERFGKVRTLHDLRGRRIAGSLASAAVDQAYSEVDETALIEEFIRRKYRAADRETLFKVDKDLAAAYRRLLRAGFRSGTIVKVLKRFAQNPDLLDSIEPDAEETPETN